MNLRKKAVVRTVQIIFGLWLLFTGIIGFFPNFAPQPQFNEAGTTFLTALFSTGYLVYFMFAIFILAGLMFVFNKLSAFAVILLSPITFNIVLFHIFLDFTNWWLAFIFAVFNVYLLIIHWPRYKKIFEK